LIDTTEVAAVPKTLYWCCPGVTERNYQEIFATLEIQKRYIPGTVHRSMTSSNNQQDATQTAPQAVSTSVCKPEAANTVEVPDDERLNARNMLNY